MKLKDVCALTALVFSVAPALAGPMPVAPISAAPTVETVSLYQLREGQQLGPLAYRHPGARDYGLFTGRSVAVSRFDQTEDAHDWTRRCQNKRSFQC